jgi:hypothetical protein
MLYKTALLFTLWIVVIQTALGQEAESVRFGVVRVTQSTVLRDRPIVTGTALLPLTPGSRLRWIEGEVKNGFVRVITTGGRQGWVASSAIQLESQPQALLAAAPPCKPTLAACVAGCSQPGSKHALFDQLKRRVPQSSVPIPVTFADFKTLQEQADARVDEGIELSAVDRAKLTNLQISQGTVHEGSVVRLIGFIAQGLDPHANTGESVNCRLPQEQNNDFHISFAERSNQDEFDGIVVEMIPQNRPANWSLSRLKALKTQKRLLMVVGAIFYDNGHVVNSDRENPLQGQPKRFSLWEIHPIVQFFSCKKANNQCNPDNQSDWKALENP